MPDREEWIRPVLRDVKAKRQSSGVSANAISLASKMILRAISLIMRIVFDTAAMVAAIRSDAGASRYLLRAALERRQGLALLVSVPLLIEYEAVMTRPQHLRAARLTSTEVAAVLDAVAAIAEPVKLAYLWRPLLSDADDDMVLEAAINGRADAIVTFNVRDFASGAKQFGISVLVPSEVVERMEKGS